MKATPLIFILLIFYIDSEAQVKVRSRMVSSSIVPNSGNSYQIKKVVTKKLRLGNANTSKIYKCEIKVSPNPFFESFKISTDYHQSGNVTVEMFDCQGKLINWITQTVSNDRRMETMLNQKEVSEGIYFLETTFITASGNTMMHTNKIIKL